MFESLAPLAYLLLQRSAIASIVWVVVCLGFLAALGRTRGLEVLGGPISGIPRCSFYCTLLLQGVLLPSLAISYVVSPTPNRDADGAGEQWDLPMIGIYTMTG